MSQTVPHLNAYGIFQVLPPFTIGSGNYRCGSLQSMRILVDNGIDIYNTYYYPLELTDVEYRADLAANATIVTLIPDEGEVFSLPSTYISNAPVELAVPYSRLVLSLNLGELPDDIPLAALINDLALMAGSYTGVDVTPKLHKIPTSKTYNHAEHVLKEAARQLLITQHTSFYTAKVAIEAELDLAKEKIIDLETAIIALQ